MTGIKSNQECKVRARRKATDYTSIHFEPEQNFQCHCNEYCMYLRLENQEQRKNSNGLMVKCVNCIKKCTFFLVSVHNSTSNSNLRNFHIRKILHEATKIAQQNMLFSRIYTKTTNKQPAHHIGLYSTYNLLLECTASICLRCAHIV